MAIWPTNSKASTNNVDSGSDKPRLARADIKQNIDNTNAIIDMFDIASPSNNDILVYNSTNSRFETQTPVFQQAILEVGRSVSSTNEQLDITSIIADPSNITSLTSGQFTLGVGTYLIWCWTRNGSSGSGSFELRDPDGDPIGGGVSTVITYASTNVYDGLMFFGSVEVSGSSNTFYVKHNATFVPNETSKTIPNTTFLRIVKVA